MKFTLLLPVFREVSDSLIGWDLVINNLFYTFY